MITSITKAPKSLLRRRALVRIDLNSEGDARLEQSIPTLKLVTGIAQSTVIVSHRGRPKGGEPSLSLSKDAKKIAARLCRPVKFIAHLRFEEIRETIVHAPKGSIFLLENIRFLEGEEKNDPALGQELASLADYYVNDAFSVSHRADASVVAITRFLPSYAGLELTEEVRILGMLKKNGKKPFVIILGGSKAKDKLGVLNAFARRADCFLLGGRPANTVLAMRGVKIDNSIYTKDMEVIKTLKKLPQKKLNIPVDWIGENRKILDIGPKTITVFKKKIASARTIFWNGPLGFFENKRFAHGTKEIARAILANKKAHSVIGGGETVAALHAAGYRLKVIGDKENIFLSTGGGAMLEFLSGNKLPGLEALEKLPSTVL